ncbi:MAG: DUF4376 domain-containing protein [Pseudomonadota bacterium]|nr:DUF4376 domain-containing protein [Pseudomonadota bacterium]
MTQYCIRRVSTQVIEGGVGRPDPEGFIGPIDEPPEYPDEFDLIPHQGNLPLGASPTPSAVLRWNGTAPEWVEEGALDTLRARKSAAISQACTDAITAGFPCDALGAGFTYPSRPNDQANLTGSVVRSFYPGNDADWRTPFWCADADDAWEFRLHTVAQIQHVGDCAVIARLSCMAKNEQMQGQVAAAETPEALDDIIW